MFSAWSAVSLLCLCSSQEYQEHPLSSDEQYLAPYLEELIDYRDNPVATKYIKLANLLDVVPTWLEDLFIPLIIPHSTLTIPLNMEIPISVQIGNLTIPLPASFTLANLTLNDLNEFKKLRPLKLNSSSKFTWDSLIELQETTAIANAKLTVLAHDIDVAVTLGLKGISLKSSMIAAFNRTRLCEVWGQTMHSSLHCAVWPMAVHEEFGVAGFNLTQLELSVQDFDFSMNLTGLGALDPVLEQELEEALLAAKPDILANLPGSTSQALRAKANTALLHALPREHAQSPCSPEAPSEALNASRVCVANNGGYVLKWKYHNCPAHFASDDTQGFDIDQSKCVDLSEVYPDAKEGDILRVATNAVAGIHELVDPHLRYVPDSNSAGFECSGTTLDYHCDFISLAPVNKSQLAQVSQVCIVNHAGFVMWFEEQNSRTGGWVASTEHYPIDQRRCVNLTNTEGVTEGDRFGTRVHAVWGKTNMAERDVEYRNNGFTASFECRGTTLNYNCGLLALESPEEFLDDNSTLVV